MWGGALVGFVQEMSSFASIKIAYQAIEDRTRATVQGSTGGGADDQAVR